MKNSKIEWTDHTINLWWGCDKIKNNPCCDHCYAETLTKRVGGDVWGAKKPRRAIASAWGDLDKINEIGRKTNTPQRVFLMSMADIFERSMPLVNHKNEPVEGTTADLRKRLFSEIDNGRYPFIIFQMLTKRPQNIRRMVPTGWLEKWPENVWVGVSVGDQANYDRLVPPLLLLPIPTTFLSIEPLLGEIDFRNKMFDGGSWGSIGGQICHDCGNFEFYESDGNYCIHCGNTSMTTHRQISLIIVGGESGAKARPMHPDWVRAIRDDCVAADTPFFFKQWGEHDADGRRVGKAAAGRLLDGREWNEMPR